MTASSLSPRPDPKEQISRLPGRRLALPSWVIPASLRENCVFLAGKADEAGLLFFETTASLAYTERDLPPALAALPLSFHVHLPLDLPWDDPGRAAAICLSLLRKVPRSEEDGRPAGEFPPAHCRGVLHPPPHDPAAPGGAARRLEIFARAFREGGGRSSLLLLENVRDNNLAHLTGIIREQGFSVCLDSGHMLAWGQEQDLLRNDALLERTEMLHFSAPGQGCRAGAHLPLTRLGPDGARLCRELAHAAPSGSVVMLELFNWPDIERSLPLVRSWLPQQA